MNIIKLCVFFILISTCVLSFSDYKRLTDYEDTLYNLIVKYVTDNGTSNSSDILNYINSEATNTVFSDAKTAGYSRKQLIFGTYQNSFGASNPSNDIINALHDANAKEVMIDNASWYGSFVNMGVTSALLMGLSRHFWVYLRVDRPAIRFYKANHHRYMTGNLNTNNLTVNTNNMPAVPEPNFLQ